MPDKTINTPETPVTPEVAVETAPVEVPVAPPEAAPQAPVSQDPGFIETESNKLVYVLVAVLVIILLSLVGLFFYKQYMATTEPAVTPTPAMEKSVAPAESATVTPANAEEADLQEIVVPDIDEEMKAIDTDLNQL